MGLCVFSTAVLTFQNGYFWHAFRAQKCFHKINTMYHLWLMLMSSVGTFLLMCLVSCGGTLIRKGQDAHRLA